MKVFKSVLNRLRLAIEVTVLVLLLYSIVRTVLGIRVDAGDGIRFGGRGFVQHITNYVFWYSDYYDFARVKILNYGYYITEIILLILPSLIIVILELYKHRAKLIKNYQTIKQHRDAKKLQKYEEKIKQLKKGD